MQLNFRQGIVKYQRDTQDTPVFLQRGAGNNFDYVDLIVQSDPTLITFAYKNHDYLVEETKSVQRAWGPFQGANPKYLYWDLNTLTSALTRGFTEHPLLNTSTPPQAPVIDQHWFDNVENVMKVWNGSRWIEVLRVFAGQFHANRITPWPTGSQVGLDQANLDVGFVVLDSFGEPLREKDGSFVTSTTWLNVNNVGTSTVRLETQVSSGIAAEIIPKFSAVQLKPGRKLYLARSTDYRTRVTGIVLLDLTVLGTGIIVSDGVVRNRDWNFGSDKINKPVFCGPTGGITLIPPRTGVLQQIGYVYEPDAIYINLQQPIILTDPDQFNNPNPGLNLPTANFSASPLTGSVPLEVKFTNMSTGGTEIEWDFTNDGFVDSTVENPSYTYSTPGIYTVKQTVKNIYGEDDEIKLQYITVTENNSSVSSNLSIALTVPAQVQPGSPFNISILSENSGLVDGTNVIRNINIRSDNGTYITVLVKPTGSLIQRVNDSTKIQLPSISISSGTSVESILKIQTSGSARSITIEGSIASTENDVELADNSFVRTITLRA